MLTLVNSLITSSSAHEQMYSLSFDGVDDYLDIGDQLDFGTTAFSISLWFNCDDLDGTASQYIFSKRQDNNNRVSILINSSDKIQIIGKISGSNSFALAGATALTEDDHQGKWVHMVATTDRAGNEAVYINGVTTTYGQTAASTNDSANFDNTGNMVIGSSHTGSSSAFTGKIDEVAVFNVFLDADAVLAIYNEGKPFNLNNNRGNYNNSLALQGYWRMGNGLFDDKENGVVFDQTAPTIGSNLIPDLLSGDLNTDFFADSTSNGPTSNALNTADFGYPVWKMVSDGSTIAAGVMTSDLTVELNTVYKVSWEGYAVSAAGGEAGSRWQEIQKNILVAGPGDASNDWNRLGTTNAYGGFHSGDRVWKKITIYIRTASSNNQARISFVNGTATGDNGDIRYFKNFKIVKVGGNPGITTGLGDNEATFSTDTPDD